MTPLALMVFVLGASGCSGGGSADAGPVDAGPADVAADTVGDGEPGDAGPADSGPADTAPPEVVIPTDAVRVAAAEATAGRGSCAYERGAMPWETLGEKNAIGAEIPIDHVIMLMQENVSPTCGTKTCDQMRALPKGGSSISSRRPIFSQWP